MTTEIVGAWQAQEFKLLDVPVAMFQSYGEQDATVHTIRCTGTGTYHGTMRNDHVWVNRATSSATSSDLGSLVPARVMKFFNLLGDSNGAKMVAVVKLLHPEANGNVDPRTGLIRMTERDASRNSEDLVMVHVKSIWSMAHLIAIPKTNGLYVNSTIDLKMFNSFYSRTEYSAPEDLPALYYNSTDSEEDTSDGEDDSDGEGSDEEFQG